MMNVIAGSVLGGLDNIYGAIIGGIILSYTQTILPTMLVKTFGLWIASYISLAPMLVVVGVMMLMPEGIGGALTGNPGHANRLKKRINRFLGRRG